MEINMFRAITFTMLIVLAGCSSEQHDKFQGLWEKSQEGSLVVMRIDKSGEDFLLDTNVLVKTNYLGEKKEPIVLEVINGGLLFKSPDGNELIKLSITKALTFKNETYHRVTDARIAELEPKFKARLEQNKEVKTLCRELKAEYKEQRKIVKHKYKDDNPNNRDEQLERTMFKYQDMALELGDCTL